MNKQHITVITIDGDTHDYEINEPKGGEVESKNGLLSINTEKEGAIYAPGQWVSVHVEEITEEDTGLADEEAPSDYLWCPPNIDAAKFSEAIARLFTPPTTARNNR